MTRETKELVDGRRLILDLSVWLSITFCKTGLPVDMHRGSPPATAFWTEYLNVMFSNLVDLEGSLIALCRANLSRPSITHARFAAKTSNVIEAFFLNRAVPDGF